MRFLVAADTGGTFTALVVHDAESNRTEFGKTLTNYGDLTQQSSYETRQGN